ncbi:MAG: ATP-binding protein [Methyloligellaceae bacterium]
MSTEFMEQRLKREVSAREQAEKLLEERSLELHSMNLVLQNAANRLSLLNAQQDKILEKIWTGVLLLDEEYKVIRSNAYAEKAFQISEQEIIGTDVSRLVACNSSQIDKLRSIGRNVEEEQSEIEILGYRCDGDRFPLMLTITETKIHEKKHYIWIFRDLSKEKQNREKRERLEEELRRALRLESLGTLASGLAHEINTPVQYVGDNLFFLRDAFADLLAAYDEAIQDKEVQDIVIQEGDEERVDLEFLRNEIPTAVSQALEGVDRVSDIIRSVRNFSHPGAKEKQLVDLNKAIENTVTISRNQWKYVAEVKCSLDQDLGKVECIPGEINQVLLNLIVNAAHAIEEKGASNQGMIEIQSRAILDYIEVRIKDTGCGISSKNKDRIFDPFFTTKGVGKGTGQGLSLAYNTIVSGHGGKLLFETKEGEGTTFIVLLPTKSSAESEQVIQESCI